MHRILALCAVLASAAPASAATGPFTVLEQDNPARDIILVVGEADSCAEIPAAFQAALAAQSGRAIGIVATDAACGAAASIMDSAPDLAFADSAQSLGAEPNEFLAQNRSRGIYVWSLDTYRRLDLSQRQVLGVFAGETQAAMIEAALHGLSRDGDGYFLLVQTNQLDEAARAALEGAQRNGASIIGPDLIHLIGGSFSD
jgi:alkaline phosphatase